MIQRALPVVLVIAVLGGLIGYSQWRSAPNRVSGFVEADEIRLGSRVGGRVMLVFVEEGQRVDKDQRLVEIEPYDLLQREQEALDTLAAREAEYQRLKNGLREEEKRQAKARVDQLAARLDLLVEGPRQEEIKAAEGRLQAAEAELLLARQLRDRKAGLLQERAIAQDEMDRAEEALKAALAWLDVRTQELALLNAGTREEEKREAAARLEEARLAWELAKLGFRNEEIAQAKAARDAAQAALNVVREQMKELTIRSPVDGVVEAFDLQPGDLVPAGAPVISVLDNSSLWVRAYVPQNRAGLQVGDRLRVTVDSLPDEDLTGTVIFISRQAEFTPSNVQTRSERAKQVFRIKVELQDAGQQLHPGIAADVWLDPITKDNSPSATDKAR